MPLGIKPTVDFAFKKIFGSPENVPVLVGLLNAILRLASPIVQAEILNPFSYQDFAEDKLVVLDIRARDAEGRWFNSNRRSPPSKQSRPRRRTESCMTRGKRRSETMPGP
jgi:predicted transposase/invertase (TIGR01784 family)